MTEECGRPAGRYPSDCEITAGLRQRAMARNQRENERGYVWRSCLPRAREIELLLLDVDGVLTDGTIVYSHSGTEQKSFHTRDGFGLRLLRESGVQVGLITARSSEAVRRRAADLGISLVHQGVADKLAVYDELRRQLSLVPSQVAYMGDDWLDLPLLRRVGFAATVADAVVEVRKAVHYVARLPGGRGAVREVCDLIIEARGRWQELWERYNR